MHTSIAQARQQLSALIAAAQTEPQVLTNRHHPVAVLVSTDYFQRTAAAAQPQADSLHSQVLQLRERYLPSDDLGLPGADAPTRAKDWQRPHAFDDSN